VTTGRELCVHVARLGNPTGRTLDEYLRALWRLGLERRRAGVDQLRPVELIELLTEAFAAPPVPFDPGWRALRDQTIEELPDGFTQWEATVRDQIVDLDELDRSGLAERARRRPQRFGVDAPGGSRWFNLEPVSFLISACAGTFAASDYDRGLDDSWPRFSADDPLTDVDWERFAHFLARGQLPCAVEAELVGDGQGLGRGGERTARTTPRPTA